MFILKFRNKLLRRLRVMFVIFKGDKSKGFILILMSSLAKLIRSWSNTIDERTRTTSQTGKATVCNTVNSRFESGVVLQLIGSWVL